LPKYVGYIYSPLRIGVARESLGDHAPKSLAYLVILCFEKRRPKQKYSC